MAIALVFAACAVVWHYKQQQRSFNPKSPDIGPKIGEPAKDFTLKYLNEDRELTLSDYYADKPVVLIFGSFTCPPFRQNIVSINDLYDQYKDEVNFIFVYTLEAHTEDGWQLDANKREEGLIFDQPETMAEREEVASTCQSVLLIDIPILVDTMDNAQVTAYSALPNRVYLIDQGGTVLYRGERKIKGGALRLMSNPKSLLKALNEL